jgi:hypothetical protein
MPATIVPPPGAGLVGGSNYTFADSCNALTNLVVTATLTQDLVTNNGFGLQLNAHTQKQSSTLGWQQFCFCVDPSGRVQGTIDIWSAGNAIVLLQWADICYIPAGILPAGSTITIALSTDANKNVTGALYSLQTSYSVKPGSALIGFSGGDNTQHVNYIGENGHVYETYIPTTGAWSYYDLIALSGNGVAPAPGSPLPGYWGTDGSRHINFVGTDGHVHELYQPAGASWSNNDLTTFSGGGVTPAAGQSLHSYWGADSSQHVNFVGTDGHVHELYIMPGISWRTNDLTVASGSTVAPRSLLALGGFADSTGSQHVHYIGVDGHIYEIYANAGAGWAHNDLTAASKSSAIAAVNSPLFSYFGPQASQHINFIGTDGHVHEIYANAGQPWGNNDLTVASHAVVGPRADSPLHSYTDITQHVNYIGTDGHVYELYASPAGWVANDLTVLSGNSMAAANGSALDGYAQPNGSQHVNYVGVDGKLHELYIYPGRGWAWNIISNISVVNYSQPIANIQGYKAGDTAPITAFQLVLVGHDSGQWTTLSSGAGTLHYQAAEALTALSVIPTQCTNENQTTGEWSNCTYAQLYDTASQAILQNFSTGPAAHVDPKLVGRMTLPSASHQPEVQPELAMAGSAASGK